MIVIVAPIIAIIICILHYLINEKPFEKAEQLELPQPFILSEYYDRIEKAALDILETQEPVDQIIILWWGLDGLRLNEDGSLEWISRKKPKTVNQGVFYQPMQSMAQVTNINGCALQQPTYMVPPQFDMFQNTQATINALHAQNMALQMQTAQNAQNMAMMAALQSCVVPYPYDGIGGGGGSGSTVYYSPLTDYCCNRLK